jgi:hypothetical protein
MLSISVGQPAGVGEHRGEEREFFGVGQTTDAGLQSGRHEIVGVLTILQAQNVAVFV